MNKLLTCISALFLLAVFPGISQAEMPFITTPDGLEYKDLRVGEGKQAQPGEIAVIHFTGWLNDSGRRGKEIFNSRKQQKHVAFLIGTDRVMPAWNKGVVGMQAGGMRMLRIPPELAYGAKSVDNLVPPHAHLIFIIELLELKNPPGVRK